MVQREFQKVLNILTAEEYRTAVQLAEELGVSEKTIRLRIKALNEEIEAHGAVIESRPRYGYRLVITDPERFRQYEGQSEDKADHYIPDNSRERNEYLLAYLMWHKDYVKADELCDALYISKPTLTKSLHYIEKIFKRYHLMIERKPNYGMKLQGKELDVRRLFCDYFIKRNSLVELNREKMDQEMLELAKAIRGMLREYEIPLSETAFENFVEYVYAAGKRMSQEYYLEISTDDIPEMGIREKSFVADLSGYLEQRYGSKVTEEEKSYLLLYLSGKRMVGNVVENDTNFVIREHLDRIALEMLDYIFQTFHMDFRNDFDIRMTLNQHLVPLDIRLRYDIPLHNPMLDKIRMSYSLAYQMSCETAKILEQHYQTAVSEDEIGYLALIFELAIERRKIGEKSDILVVCSTGKGSSRLLKYKYEQEFGDYLNQIYVCDLIGLEHFDFSKVNYVFTTVPVTREIPVPIVEVGTFLGQEDVRKVTEILRRGTAGYLQEYYKESRFFAHVQCESKEEVLEYLCERIAAQEEVDEDFFDQVLEREAYIQMDYGNLVAIPHPNRIASEESFVYTAVLEKPVMWNQNPAQVILLVSIGRKEDKNRQKLYEATARFALSKSAVDQLIRTPAYEILLQLLKEEN